MPVLFQSRWPVFAHNGKIGNDRRTHTKSDPKVVPRTLIRKEVNTYNQK